MPILLIFQPSLDEVGDGAMGDGFTPKTKI
jgi:hypothetical protein